MKKFNYFCIVGSSLHKLLITNSYGIYLLDPTEGSFKTRSKASITLLPSGSLKGCSLISFGDFKSKIF